MKPLPWEWALFVWGYALAWFLVNDRVKLLAYWILDPTKAKTPSEHLVSQPGHLDFLSSTNSDRSNLMKEPADVETRSQEDLPLRRNNSAR